MSLKRLCAAQVLARAAHNKEEDAPGEAFDKNNNTTPAPNMQVADYAGENHQIDDLSSKVEFIMQTLAGRQNVVPKYFVSQKGLKGYSPICKNLFRSGLCGKITGGKCKGCPNVDYQPLNVGLLEKHFSGDILLGIYPMLPGDVCNFIAADLDDHEGNKGTGPLADAMAVSAVLTRLGLAHIIFRSKSGTGYHIYIIPKSCN